jgi:hypothetical protein
MDSHTLTIEHEVLTWPGISYPIENPEDASVVLEILGWNYDRAKAAAERRGSQASEE